MTDGALGIKADLLTIGVTVGTKVVVFAEDISTADFVPGTVAAIQDGFVTLAVGSVTLNDGIWPVPAPFVAGDVVSISFRRITGIVH